MRPTSTGPVRRGGVHAYNRQANLDTWYLSGEYPPIHDALLAAYASWCFPVLRGVVLDMGCSTGLLGRRIADLGEPVVWAEGDADAAQRGIQAGVIDPDALWLGTLHPDTWTEFAGWCLERRVQVIVARRVLDVCTEQTDPDAIADHLHDTGARYILIEGLRAPTKHPFGPVDSVVSMLAGRFDLVRSSGPDIRLVKRR